MTRSATQGLCFSCPSCRRARQPHHYLCPACWYRLSPQARRQLWRKDDRAAVRLRQLYTAIQRQVPLGEIQID